MRFYGREKEMAMLRETEKQAETEAQLTVISGRRRIGKTALVRHSTSPDATIHLVVGQKNEALLCEELTRLAELKFGESLGKLTSIATAVEAIMEVTRHRCLTLVIDDFQNLSTNVQKDIADVWQENHKGCHLNMIICCGRHSYAEGIAASRHIRLEPFGVETIKTIIADINPTHTADDLLTFCMLTGGVARYVEELVERNALTRDEMLHVALSPRSFFLSEGIELLSAEFGKDCNTYFSILAAIADGYTTRSEITSHINVECGGYLDKLEKNYNLIRRHRPYLQPEGARNMTYGLKDNYLTFWLRYVYKHNSLVETGDWQTLSDIVRDDYATFATQNLERYFRQKMRESGEFDMVSNYWEKGGTNAIPIIAVSEAKRRMLVADCGGNILALKAKAKSLMDKLPEWQFDFAIMTSEDM